MHIHARTRTITIIIITIITITITITITTSFVQIRAWCLAILTLLSKAAATTKLNNKVAVAKAEEVGGSQCTMYVRGGGWC